MNAWPQPDFASTTEPLRLRRRSGLGGEADAWLAMPSVVQPDARPLVAVHGIKRAAKTQARAFARLARTLGRPVIAPLFDAPRFPRYQLAVGRDRADQALLRLLDSLGWENGIDTSRIDLCGYSGGAQFAHRFAWLYPDRIAELTLVAAGWYTFPDDAPFPLGLGTEGGRGSRWARTLADRFAAFARLPIHVVVGALDNVPDANTRSGPSIDRQQGIDRWTRAQNWAHAMRARAPGSIAFTSIGGCGHDFKQLVRRGGLDRLVLAVGDGAPAMRHATDAGRLAA